MVSGGDNIIGVCIACNALTTTASTLASCGIWLRFHTLSLSDADESPVRGRQWLRKAGHIEFASILRSTIRFIS